MVCHSSIQASIGAPDVVGAHMYKRTQLSGRVAMRLSGTHASLPVCTQTRTLYAPVKGRISQSHVRQDHCPSRIVQGYHPTLSERTLVKAEPNLGRPKPIRNMQETIRIDFSKPRADFQNHAKPRGDFPNHAEPRGELLTSSNRWKCASWSLAMSYRPVYRGWPWFAEKPLQPAILTNKG